MHCGIQKEMDFQANTINKDKCPTLIMHHTKWNKSIGNNRWQDYIRMKETVTQMEIIVLLIMTTQMNKCVINWNH
jgi:hypothetical protein